MVLPDTTFIALTGDTSNTKTAPAQTLWMAFGLGSRRSDRVFHAFYSRRTGTFVLAYSQYGWNLVECPPDVETVTIRYKPVQNRSVSA
jgi:hypothetical protein